MFTGLLVVRHHLYTLCKREEREMEERVGFQGNLPLALGIHIGTVHRRVCRGPLLDGLLLARQETPVMGECVCDAGKGIRKDDERESVRWGMWVCDGVLRRDGTGKSGIVPELPVPIAAHV